MDNLLGRSSFSSEVVRFENLLAAKVEKQWVLCTQYLNTKEKVVDFLAHYAELEQEQRRFLFIEADSIDASFKNIELQKSFLAELEVISLNIALESLFFNPKDEKISPFTQKNKERMSKLENTWAWHQFTALLDQEMQIFLKKFRAEPLNLYQIEAHFIDFHHEVSSVFLQTLIKEYIQAITSLSSQEKNAIEIEETLIELRGKMKPSLITMRDLLKEMETPLKKVEYVYPELKALQEKMRTIELYLTHELNYHEETLSWQKRVYLITLLAKQFNFTVVISSETGKDKAAFLWVLFQALFCLQDDLTDSDLKNNQELKKLIWDLMEKYFPHKVQERSAFRFLKETEEYLFFFPEVIQRQKAGGKWEQAKIVKLDPVTQIPFALTDFGKDALIALT